MPSLVRHGRVEAHHEVVGSWTWKMLGFMQERPCRDVPGSLLDHDTKILKKNSSKQNQVTLLLAIAALYYRRSRPLHRTPDSKQCCPLVTQSYSSTMAKTEAKSCSHVICFALNLSWWWTPSQPHQPGSNVCENLSLLERVEGPSAMLKHKRSQPWTWNNDSSTIHPSSPPPQVQP